MTVVTKFNIGQIVFHRVSMEECIITSILIHENGYTEYRVSLGIANYGFVSESELVTERTLVL